jgi:hypothetical protein
MGDDALLAYPRIGRAPAAPSGQTRQTRLEEYDAMAPVVQRLESMRPKPGGPRGGKNQGVQGTVPTIEKGNGHALQSVRTPQGLPHSDYPPLRIKRERIEASEQEIGDGMLVKRERVEPSIGNLKDDLHRDKLRLLQQEDWAGLRLTRPISIDFVDRRRKENFGKRRKIHQSHSKTHDQVSGPRPHQLIHYGPLDEAGGPYMSGALPRAADTETIINVRIGNDALQATQTHLSTLAEDRQLSGSFSRRSTDSMLLDQPGEMRPLRSKFPLPSSDFTPLEIVQAPQLMPLTNSEKRSDGIPLAKDDETAGTSYHRPTAWNRHAQNHATFAQRRHSDWQPKAPAYADADFTHQSSPSPTDRHLKIKLGHGATETEMQPMSRNGTVDPSKTVSEHEVDMSEAGVRDSSAGMRPPNDGNATDDWVDGRNVHVRRERIRLEFKSTPTDTASKSDAGLAMDAATASDAAAIGEAHRTHVKNAAATAEWEDFLSLSGRAETGSSAQPAKDAAGHCSRRTLTATFGRSEDVPVPFRDGLVAAEANYPMEWPAQSSSRNRLGGPKPEPVRTRTRSAHDDELWKKFVFGADSSGETEPSNPEPVDSLRVQLSTDTSTEARTQDDSFPPGNRRGQGAAKHSQTTRSAAETGDDSLAPFHAPSEVDSLQAAAVSEKGSTARTPELQTRQSDGGMISSKRSSAQSVESARVVFTRPVPFAGTQRAVAHIGHYARGVGNGKRRKRAPLPRSASPASEDEIEDD